MKIEAIQQDSPHLEAVKQLGKANAKVLGLFPEGAFDEYASKGTILVAINSEAVCAGYLLYRVTRNIVYIAHLCVAEGQRGRGVARQLMNVLVQKTASCVGISLKCRPEYAANKVWPKFGFEAVRKVAGRGKDGTKLTQWWRDQTPPPLFTSSHKKREPTVLGVIDANVFFDLISSEVERPQCVESKALLADWLSESIELLVTPELRDEIRRSKTNQHSAARVDDYRQLDAQKTRFDDICSKLFIQFPTATSARDRSDLCQLAWAIAGDAAYFLTRDEPLLARSEIIEQRYGIAILRPRDLIVNLDEIRRSVEYQPVRFAGSLLKLRRLQNADERIANEFRHPTDESKHTFVTTLRNAMAETFSSEVLIAFDQSDIPLALFSISFDADRMNVPLLRVRRSPLAGTLFRQVVWQIMQRAAAHKCELLHISDPHLDDVAPMILEGFGFIEKSGWYKLNLLGLHTIQRSAEWAQARSVLPSTQATGIGVYGTSATLEDPKTLWSEELRLWPGKLSDATIPTYIISIKPKWAHRLFDEGLAAQVLFGRDERLALNTEGVYYRSARPRVEAFSRVLWYVTADSAYQDVSAVRACSYIQNVVTDRPKALFKRFKRLGVYEWDDVFGTAQQRLDNSLMAIHFGHTELLKKPIARQEVLTILGQEGIGTTFQGPTKITSKAFARLYESACA